MADIVGLNISDECSCPGCSEEHKAGEPCGDATQLAVAFVGDVLRGVCVECAIEIIKKII